MFVFWKAKTLVIGGLISDEEQKRLETIPPPNQNSPVRESLYLSVSQKNAH